jgi:hypothetical protein
MKRKIVGIFVCMLLIATLIPVGCSSMENSNEIINDKTTDGMDEIENHLAEIEIIHQSLWRIWNWIEVTITPMQDVFEFPQDENGYVRMEFNITVKHRLASKYFSVFRESVGHIWVSYKNEDYLENKEYFPCTELGFNTTPWPIEADYLLPTNNQNVTPTVWLCGNVRLFGMKFFEFPFMARCAKPWQITIVPIVPR